MLKTRLFELIEDYIDEIEDIYPYITSEFDENILLRVKIASLKLDILFFLSERATREHLHTYTEIKNLRKIYIYTRKIRNIHIQRNLAHQYMLDHYLNLYDYVKFLDKREEKAGKVFIRLWVEFNLKNIQSEKKLIHGSLVNYSDAEMERIISKSINQLFLTIYSHKSRSNEIEWRKTRRRVVVLRFALELASIILPEKIHYKLQLTKVKETMAQLDKWQQYYIALKYFDAYRKSVEQPDKLMNSNITFDSLLAQKAAIHLQKAEEKLSNL